MSQLDAFMSEAPLPPSRHRGRARIVVGVALVVAVVAAGWFGVNAVKGVFAVDDYPGPGSRTVSVVVERGDSLTAIAGRLEAADVVASTEAFLLAAEADERAVTIGPGTYEMLQQMSGSGALARMLDPAARAQGRLVLPEGLTLEKSVDVIADATEISRKDLDAALADPASLDLPKWAKDRPEGFLFPATYDLAGDEDAPAILNRLVRRFDQMSSDLDLVARADDLGRSPYEVLVVASLVQAEGVTNDFAKVARVIYNRLDAGMPLQLDSTVSYALGITDIQLDDEQLATKSPYNTYVNTGLTPTPINSPGEAAIEAALSPAKGKWLYFVTVDPTTGETKFTKNYDTFLKFKAEFQRNLKSQSD